MCASLVLWRPEFFFLLNFEFTVCPDALRHFSSVVRLLCAHPHFVCSLVRSRDYCATLGVGFTLSCLPAYRCFSLIWDSVSSSRRSAQVLQTDVLYVPIFLFTLFGIVSSSRRSSSVCQILVSVLPEVSHYLIWIYSSALRRWASRRSASVCRRRVLSLPF